MKYPWSVLHRSNGSSREPNGAGHAPGAASNKLTDSEVSRRELRQLKWLTALVPGTVVLIYEYARQETLEHVLPALPVQYGNVVVWGLVLLLTYAFAAFVFRIVERLQAQALARSRNVVTLNAVLEERARLSRELHDGFAQLLAYMLVRSVTDNLYQDVRESISELRTRVSERGLPATVREYVDEYEDRHGIRVNLQGEAAARELPALSALLAQRDIGPNAHAVAVDPDTATCTFRWPTSAASRYYARSQWLHRPVTTLTNVRPIQFVVRPTRGLLLASALLVGMACSGQTQPGAAGGQPTAQAVTEPASAAASAAAVASPPPAASTRKWNFDREPVGGLPSGAQSFGGQWTVRAEPDAPSPPNALCQTGNADFPAIGLDDKPYTDLTLVAHFKPISGKTDQAGGLIFRVQDKGNYYILRANALEDNVIFFTYINAQRSQLKGANAKVTPNTWHELRVEVRGNAFVGSMDGKQVVDSSDSRYTAGGIGLWTKSDSVTCFDDVEVTA